MQAVEQLHCVVEQGSADKQPHLIILSTDSGASDASTGSQIVSRLLVSAFIDHPLCTGFISG